MSRLRTFSKVVQGMLVRRLDVKVLAFTSNVEHEQRMIDEKARIHRTNANTINEELRELDTLDNQIQKARLTLNWRKNSSFTTI